MDLFMAALRAQVIWVNLDWFTALVIVEIERSIDFGTLSQLFLLAQRAQFGVADFQDLDDIWHECVIDFASVKLYRLLRFFSVVAAQAHRELKLDDWAITATCWALSVFVHNRYRASLLEALGQMFSMNIGRAHSVRSIEWISHFLIWFLVGQSASSACAIEHIWGLAGLLSVSLELFRCCKVLDMGLQLFCISVKRPYFLRGALGWKVFSAIGGRRQKAKRVSPAIVSAVLLDHIRQCRAVVRHTTWHVHIPRNRCVKASFGWSWVRWEVVSGRVVRLHGSRAHHCCRNLTIREWAFVLSRRRRWEQTWRRAGVVLWAGCRSTLVRIGIG